MYFFKKNEWRDGEVRANCEGKKKLKSEEGRVRSGRFDVILRLSAAGREKVPGV